MPPNRTLQSNRPDHCLQTRSLRRGLSSGARLRVSPAALPQRDQDGGCLLSVELRLSTIRRLAARSRRSAPSPIAVVRRLAHAVPYIRLRKG